MVDRQREPARGAEVEPTLTYAGYLQLPTLLGAQRPLSDPPVHDEMLFVVQHQIVELWMKLIIHELKHAMARLKDNDINTCLASFDRVRQVLDQLVSQWAVLETLAPSQYLKFRDALGSASGFQSWQYRCIEALFGRKDHAVLAGFAGDAQVLAQLQALHAAPALFDEMLRWLARRGHPVPAETLERDWSQPCRPNESVLPVLRRIYENPQDFALEYQFCEHLVAMEERLQVWRFRHLKLVERIIGHRPGTGGSAGVAFLRKSLDYIYFPELYQVRSGLGR